MSMPSLLMSSSFSVSLKLNNSNYLLDGTFMDCDGFDFNQEVIQFREVTGGRWGKAMQGRTQLTNLPGNAEGGNLILRRGMNISKSLWGWFAAVQEGDWFKQRRKMSVTFYQESYPGAEFEFTEAWPTRYRIGDMKADASTAEIEEVEISYEGFKRV